VNAFLLLKKSQGGHAEIGFGAYLVAASRCFGCLMGCGGEGKQARYLEPMMRWVQPLLERNDINIILAAAVD